MQRQLITEWDHCRHSKISSRDSFWSSINGKNDSRLFHTTSYAFDVEVDKRELFTMTEHGLWNIIIWMASYLPRLHFAFSCLTWKVPLSNISMKWKMGWKTKEGLGKNDFITGGEWSLEKLLILTEWEINENVVVCSVCFCFVKSCPTKFSCCLKKMSSNNFIFWKSCSLY